ncbi:hypothetical protein CGRA01v4_05399 [Colletotrichum graminicola]|nr:hypothetical protein CGRA01v4_05399 [Colletotrichum graminicola]
MTCRRLETLPGLIKYGNQPGDVPGKIFKAIVSKTDGFSEVLIRVVSF